MAWSNDLIGGSSLLSLGGTQTPGGLSSLLTGGSGRVWAQDGKVRLESQGQNGDFVVVGNGATVWTWDSMTTTATQYTLPAQAGSSTASPAPSPRRASIRRPPSPGLIARLAPTATLSVDGQATVAGRQTYTLTLTPTSSITSVGSVTVAIDGQRWVPLQVQVFAKGDTTAVLSAGFKTVSFAPSSDSLFTFTPPSGATIVHKTVKAPVPQGMGGSDAAGKTAQHKPLTLAQAKAQAPFLLTPASTPAGVEFRGAFVTPTRGASAATPATGLTPAQRNALTALGKHPTAVLAYGTGFGTVVVIESQDDDRPGRPDRSRASARSR